MPVTRSQSNIKHRSETDQTKHSSAHLRTRTESSSSIITAPVSYHPLRSKPRRQSSAGFTAPTVATSRIRTRRTGRVTSSPHLPTQYQQRQMAQQLSRERRLRSVLALFDPDDTTLVDPPSPSLQQGDGLLAVRADLYNSFCQAVVTGALSSGGTTLYNKIISSVEPSVQDIDKHRRQALRELSNYTRNQIDVFTCADSIKEHIAALDTLGNRNLVASKFASGVMLLILEQTIRLGMIDNPTVYSHLRPSGNDVFVVTKVLSFGEELLRPHGDRIRDVLAVIKKRQTDHGENVELGRMFNQLSDHVRRL